MTDADKAILAAADALYAKAREAMDRQGIKHYLDAVWAVVADANRYFAGEEPWAKRKTDPERMEHDPLRDGRGGAAGGDPGGAGGARGRPASCSTAWGREPTRAASRRWARPAACSRGTPIPPPTGVFPRYVEPGRRAGAGGETEEAETAQKGVTISPLPVLTGRGLG